MSDVTPLGGRLYDRVAGHRVMAVMLVGITLTLGLTPVVSRLGLLLVVLLILGLAEGAVDVGGNTLLVWVHRHKVGPFMNGLHFFFGVGAFLSPIIIAQAVLRSGDITWAYWLLALIVFPIALWLLHLPSPVVQTISKDGPDGQVNHRLIAIIAVFFFLYVGAESSFGGWIFSYTVALNLVNETIAAYLTSAFWGALTVGRLLAVPLATRFRPRSILLSDLCGCITSAGIIMLWPNSLVALWLGTVGLGLSMASIFPTTISLAGRRMTITGQVTGWFFVGASAGGMSLPWLVGQLFEATGPRALRLIMMGVLIVAMVVAFTITRYSSQAGFGRKKIDPLLNAAGREGGKN